MSFNFDNRFVAELPGDPELGNAPAPGPWRLLVEGFADTRGAAAAARLVARSGATPRHHGGTDVASPEFAEVFGGNRLLPGMQAYAACYGGHQFGNWAGQLGDGRAINLGEVINRGGQRWELQLKGAGPTPYARRADGRAVLRSSIREFLCSEAMHHLGVPTTRALSLVTTGETVLRDMFYDGNPRHEPGAVVCRVAPSFIRFGNFETAGVARRRRHCWRGWRISPSPATFPKSKATPRQSAAAGSWKSANAAPAWWRTGCGSASSMA